MSLVPDLSLDRTVANATTTANPEKCPHGSLVSWFSMEGEAKCAKCEYELGLKNKLADLDRKIKEQKQTIEMKEKELNLRRTFSAEISLDPDVAREEPTPSRELNALSVDDVTRLLKYLKMPIEKKVIRENRIDGEKLATIERMEDLAALGIHLQTLKCKILFYNIMAFKVEGVAEHFLKIDPSESSDETDLQGHYSEALKRSRSWHQGRSFGGFILETAVSTPCATPPRLNSFNGSNDNYWITPVKDSSSSSRSQSPALVTGSSSKHHSLPNLLKVAVTNDSAVSSSLGSFKEVSEHRLVGIAASTSEDVKLTPEAASTTQKHDSSSSLDDVTETLVEVIETESIILKASVPAVVRQHSDELPLELVELGSGKPSQGTALEAALEALEATEAAADSIVQELSLLAVEASSVSEDAGIAISEVEHATTASILVSDEASASSVVDSSLDHVAVEEPAKCVATVNEPLALEEGVLLSASSESFDTSVPVRKPTVRITLPSLEAAFPSSSSTSEPSEDQRPWSAKSAASETVSIASEVSSEEESEIMDAPSTEEATAVLSVMPTSVATADPAPVEARAVALDQPFLTDISEVFEDATSEEAVTSPSAVSGKTDASFYVPKQMFKEEEHNTIHHLPPKTPDPAAAERRRRSGVFAEGLRRTPEPVSVFSQWGAAITGMFTGVAYPSIIEINSAASVIEALNLLAYPKETLAWETVRNTLRDIHTLLSLNVDSLKAAVALNAVELTTDVLNSWKTETEVVKSATSVLQLMSKESKHQELFGQEMVTELLIECLDAYQTVPEIVTSICVIFKNITAHENRENIILLDVGGVCIVLADLLKQYKNEATICLEVLHVVRHMTVYETSTKFLGKLGICELIVKILRLHSNNRSIVSAVCKVVKHIAVDEGNELQLGSEGIADVFIEVVKLHPGDDILITKVCSAIMDLSYTALNQLRFGAAGICTMLVNVLKKFQFKELVIETVCGTIKNLAVNDEIEKLFGRVGACEVLTDLMNLHGKNSVLVEAICATIKNLACDDENRVRFGAAGACELLVDLAVVHKKNERIKAAVKNLRINPENKKRFQALGVK